MKIILETPTRLGLTTRMFNTAYATAVLSEIRADRKAAASKFEATKAIAQIGIVSEIPGVYTLSTLNGPRKMNWEAVEFESPIDAIKSYAKAMFGQGVLKKGERGTFLVY